MQTEMSSPPTGGLCLLSGKHTGILTHFLTIVKGKRPKMNFFWPPPLAAVTFSNTEYCFDLQTDLIIKKSVAGKPRTIQCINHWPHACGLGAPARCYSSLSITLLGGLFSVNSISLSTDKESVFVCSLIASSHSLGEGRLSANSFATIFNSVAILAPM